MMSAPKEYPPQVARRTGNMSSNTSTSSSVLGDDTLSRPRPRGVVKKALNKLSAHLFSHASLARRIGASGLSRSPSPSDEDGDSPAGSGSSSCEGYTSDSGQSASTNLSLNNAFNDLQVNNFMGEMEDALLQVVERYIDIDSSSSCDGSSELSDDTSPADAQPATPQEVDAFLADLQADLNDDMTAPKVVNYITCQIPLENLFEPERPSIEPHDPLGLCEPSKDDDAPPSHARLLNPSSAAQLMHLDPCYQFPAFRLAASDDGSSVADNEETNPARIQKDTSMTYLLSGILTDSTSGDCPLTAEFTTEQSSHNPSTSYTSGTKASSLSGDSKTRKTKHPKRKSRAGKVRDRERMRKFLIKKGIQPRDESTSVSASASAPANEKSTGQNKGSLENPISIASTSAYEDAQGEAMHIDAEEGQTGLAPDEQQVIFEAASARIAQWRAAVTVASNSAKRRRGYDDYEERARKRVALEVPEDPGRYQVPRKVFGGKRATEEIKAIREAAWAEEMAACGYQGRPVCRRI